jgi:hypothetical protein
MFRVYLFAEAKFRASGWLWGKLVGRTQGRTGIQKTRACCCGVELALEPKTYPNIPGSKDAYQII